MIECRLQDLWLDTGFGPATNFKPTPYQKGINYCFDLADGDRLWFPKESRQIGLTTILLMCIAKQMLAGKNTLLVVPSSVNNYKRRIDFFASQWHYKHWENRRSQAPAPSWTGEVKIGANSVSLWQTTNSFASDIVVIDEAKYGTYKMHSQLDFLYPTLRPGASIFIFGA